MAPSNHVGKFLPKTKGFFPHDFTLIASVVGESVIGHGIGRNISQLKNVYATYYGKILRYPT